MADETPRPRRRKRRTRPAWARDMEQVNKVAGVLATWGGTCSRCGREFHRTQVVKHHNEWIHVVCSSGQDE